MFTKDGISTTLAARKEPLRAAAGGTTRKPAARKRFSPQPANFDGTLSQNTPSPGPLAMIILSVSRNESSTAFFSH